MTGVVIRSTGSWYEVKVENGTIIKCRLTGKFRQKDRKLTNPIAVGDYVKILIAENEENIGTIKEIENRKNYVVRQSPRKKHQLHIIASNIDRAILITSINHPKIKQGFIDRFLMMTAPYNIPVTIVFNKSDLYDEKDHGIYDFLASIYNKIGYQTLLTSIVTNQGIEDLKTILKDKTTLLSGQSGVGKSSIINAIQPDFELRTEILSDFTGKGQHTTTFAEMFDLDIGGQIIDTPGIKTLSYNHLEEMDVAHNFKEFFEYSTNCKYSNCMHRNEPKCAVKNAIETGEISELRYQNYLAILEEIENQNYWEINSDY